MSVPPPRGHQAQPHDLRQPQPERPGLAVQAHVHHRPFLSALSDEAERVPRTRPRELLQPCPGGEADSVVQLVGGRVRRVEVRDPGEVGDDLVIGAKESQQRARRTQSVRSVHPANVSGTADTGRPRPFAVAAVGLPRVAERLPDHFPDGVGGSQSANAAASRSRASTLPAKTSAPPS
ncbi:hypothetical protein GCM10020254_79420 [Streptomyces goshikiensis]